MKYIIASLIIFLLVGCQFKNMDKEANSENGFIMEDYPWSLDMDKLNLSQADSLFDMMQSEHGVEMSKIVVNKPSVKIKYSYGQYDEITKYNSFVLNADNGKDFSAREILFKINNNTYRHLKNDPHYFFEGLEFEGYEGDIPVYSIAQGS